MCASRVLGMEVSPRQKKKLNVEFNRQFIESFSSFFFGDPARTV